MTILAVSFDVWDTLLKLKPFHALISKEIAQYNNMDSNRLYQDMLKNYHLLKEYRQKGILRNNDIVNHCLELSAQNLCISVESLKKGVTKAVLEIEPNDILVKEAPEILDELLREGKQIVTLGNLIYWPGAYNRILLERVGLTKYFKLQLYADEVKYSKPSREIFSRLCQDLNLEPKRIVHVGDNRIEDFEGALNFGSYAIWVTPSSSKVVKIQGRGAVINSIVEIPKTIKLFERGC